MRGLEAFGLTADAMFGELPELQPMAERALQAWNFCDGWAPERWPAFAAFHAVDDWLATVDLMQAIRAELNAEARRE